MLKRGHQEEHENHERWLVSYADFITLLFAFFTMLYGLSQTDKLQMTEAILSIQRAFLSGGGIFPLKGYPLTPFESPPGKGSQVPPSHEELGSYPKSGDVKKIERLTASIQGLFDKNGGLGLSKSDIEVLPSKEGFKIRLGEAVLFKPGSDRLRKEHLPFLFEVGKRLQGLGVPIQVEGHTDSTGVGDDQNWQLSLNRASNIVKFLVTGVSFRKDHISLAGYGDTQPLGSNDSEQGRAKNRRVEIVVLTEGKPFSDPAW